MSVSEGHSSKVTFPMRKKKISHKTESASRRARKRALRAAIARNQATLENPYSPITIWSHRDPREARAELEAIVREHAAELAQLMKPTMDRPAIRKVRVRRRRARRARARASRPASSAGDGDDEPAPAIRDEVERRLFGERTGRGADVARELRFWLEHRGWCVERGHVRHDDGRREQSIWGAARAELAKGAVHA